jgi:hypothetical protein
MMGFAALNPPTLQVHRHGEPGAMHRRPSRAEALRRLNVCLQIVQHCGDRGVPGPAAE